MLKLAVLVSGNGTNLQALIDAQKEKRLQATVDIVISNSSTAYALERAKENDIDQEVLLQSTFSNREEFDKGIVKILKERNVDIIVLAGFMRIITKELLDEFPNKIVNIHPSLLPSFPGMSAHSSVLEYGVKVTGATVHFVDEGMDTGPIILQKAVDINDDDNVESLSKRVLIEEHKLLVEAINLIAEKKIELDGRIVKIVKSKPLP